MAAQVPGSATASLDREWFDDPVDLFPSHCPTGQELSSLLLFFFFFFFFFDPRLSKFQHNRCMTLHYLL